MIANNDDNGKNVEGHRGGGELFSRKDNLRSDAKMVQRAIRERWPIDDEKRKPLIDSLFDVALNAENHALARVSAAKAILFAEAQNQKDEYQAQGQKHTHEFGESVIGALIDSAKPAKVIESSTSSRSKDLS